MLLYKYTVLLYGAPYITGVIETRRSVNKYRDRRRTRLRLSQKENVQTNDVVHCHTGEIFMKTGPHDCRPRNVSGPAPDELVVVIALHTFPHPKDACSRDSHAINVV
ncbi:hypothetical protein J6590_055417 [Homalodisca vitripennis]|nr:hypothetical protein J6590_055417 [Homalodisca vitripennis]